MIFFFTDPTNGQEERNYYQEENTNEFEDPVIKSFNESKRDFRFKIGINNYRLIFNEAIQGINITGRWGKKFNIGMKFGDNLGIAFLLEPGLENKRSGFYSFGDSATLTFDLDYFNLPLNLVYQDKYIRLNRGNYLQPYLILGFDVNILLRATLVVEFDKYDFGSFLEIKEELRPVEFVASGGGGIRWIFSPTSAFFLELKGNKGISGINNTYFQNLDFSNFGVHLMFGVSTNF